MKIHTFFLFELILLLSFNFNEITTESCDNEEILNISKEFLSLLTIDPTKLLEVGSSLFALADALKKNGDCGLDLKLDKIFNKLSVISSDIENLKFEIKCSKTINLYVALFSSMRSLAQQRLQYYQDNSNKEAKEHIRKVCIHETEGINKMFTSLTYILEENVVSDLFKDCFQYQTRYLKSWTNDVAHLAILFEFLGRLCEDVHIPADFYYKNFLSQVNERLAYYSKIMIVNKFANDYDSGVRYWIEYVIKKSKSSDDAKGSLEQRFSYFEWAVFFFKKDVYKYEYYSQNVTNLCGSRFFIDQEDLSTNVFVSWCIPNSVDNTLLNINTFEREAKNALDDIKSINKNLNYVLIIRKKDRRFLTFIKIYEPDISGSLKYRYYETKCCERHSAFGGVIETNVFNYVFSSKLAWKKKLSDKIPPLFSDTAFFFHRGKKYF